MPKDIVILLDGTSNGIAAQRTNVLRLYGCLRKSPEQLVWYDPGVGTLGADGAWSRLWRDTTELWGMATGWGIDANVKQAYRFLIEHYDAGKESGGARDRIFLFGFSRGAYTARMLAGFIHTIGLIDRRNANLIDYAWRAYKRIGEDERQDAFAEVRLYERILRPDRPPIRCLGLFDTVASVIEPGPGLWPQLKSHAFTARNPSVESVRHAVALDERRRMFRQRPWPEDQLFRRNRFGTDSVPQDAREVWFTGVHGDVGGGYPEAESALAKIALLWLIEETAAMGLDYVTQTVDRLVRGTDPDATYVRPDADAAAHDSMTRGWRIVEYLPLPEKQNGRTVWRLGRARPRSVPAGARLHASVVARARRAGGLPPHVPADHRVEGDPGDW
jgi:uncharacterized protein (DUF2235 family)